MNSLNFTIHADTALLNFYLDNTVTSSYTVSVSTTTNLSVSSNLSSSFIVALSTSSSFSVSAKASSSYSILLSTNTSLSTTAKVTANNVFSISYKCLPFNSFSIHNTNDFSLQNKTVISQYANSPKLLSVIDRLSVGLKSNSVINEFYQKIFNFNTAVGVWLDNFGRILGVDRSVTFVSGILQLTDVEYKNVLLLRVYSNCMSQTIQSYNDLLKLGFLLFGTTVWNHNASLGLSIRNNSGSGYPFNNKPLFHSPEPPLYSIKDPGFMCIIIRLHFTPSPENIFIAKLKQILNPPTGTGIFIYKEGRRFGFCSKNGGRGSGTTFNQKPLSREIINAIQ